MKKIFLFLASFLLTVCTVQNAYAQRAHKHDGAIGLGLRATPDGGGFAGKFFLNRNLAIETQLNAGGVLGWAEGTSFNAVGLLEYHIILPRPEWRIFFGAGMHGGVWNHSNGRVYNVETRTYGEDSEAIFGIDGIGGVEYRFRNAPVGLSADFKPAVNFLTDPNYFPHNMFGISARFYL